MNILVIGCGKLGSRLADSLCRHGHSVSIIDRDEDSFKLLSDEFDGMTVTGMPMDTGVLKGAGVESCDAAAAVTDDDNLNITVSQIVKEFFGIQNVVTRIIDPSREKIFKHFGLKTVCETKLSCSAMFSALVDKDLDKQLTFGSSTMSFLIRDVDHILVGRKMSEIPNRSGEIIIGVLDKDGHALIGNEKVIGSSDRIIYARVID